MNFPVKPSRRTAKNTKAWGIRGVYALMYRGHVVYIGCSEDVGLRLRQHKAKKFTHYFIYPIPEGNMRIVEQALISSVRPILNAPSTYDIVIHPGRVYKPRIVFTLTWSEYKKGLKIAKRLGFESVSALAKHLFLQELDRQDSILA